MERILRRVAADSIAGRLYRELTVGVACIPGLENYPDILIQPT